MKREFGTTLVEQYLPKHDLRLVVDTSGAYIPGHGTPTVILVGRPRKPFDEPNPLSPTVRAVLGIRGEPGRPHVPAQGLVWRSIVDHIDHVGHEDEYTSTVDLPRETLSRHPWSLSGGGAQGLLALVEAGARAPLDSVAAELGIMSVTGQDDFYMFAPIAGRREEWPTRPLVEGDAVRDWEVSTATEAGWPYSGDYGVRSLQDLGAFGHRLHQFKSALDKRRRFGTPMVERGLTWWEWQELYTAKLRTPLSIAFAFVATHNHFVLDRGGKVFKQSAPVIKLPEGASEDDHLALLGVLNSSTACFWLKQNSHNKGNGGSQ
jgi:hypothetical protein